MSIEFKERVSALVDSELTSFESRRLIDELENDAALRKRWSRYHLIGDILRDEVPVKIDRNFAAGVMERVHQETASGTVSIHANTWRKPLAGVAIAASVAVVSLLGLKNLTSEGGLTPAQIAKSENTTTTSSQPVASSGVAVANGMVQPVSIEKSNIKDLQGKAETLRPVASDPRMNDYLATHAEFAARPGIMPRVRVVGFEATEQ